MSMHQAKIEDAMRTLEVVNQMREKYFGDEEINFVEGDTHNGASVVAQIEADILLKLTQVLDPEINIMVQRISEDKNNLVNHLVNTIDDEKRKIIADDLIKREYFLAGLFAAKMAARELIVERVPEYAKYFEG